jgi:regulator of protease activity HflC (stomatin/prohibitin superfamily)
VNRARIQLAGRRWLGPLLLLLALLYWAFALYVERIDLSAPPPGWWLSMVAQFPLFELLNRVVNLLAALFSPRVLRHFIPVIVGWWLVRRGVLAALYYLYDLPDMDAARELYGRLRDGGGGPILALRRETFAIERREAPLLRVGGPGRVWVSGTDAVVTERNGRFGRVLGPGTHALLPFERVTAVLDLLPHEREAPEIQLRTKDGIPLAGSLAITFRISRGGQEPTKAEPFPFDPEAAQRAAYAVTVLPEGAVNDWDEAPLEIAKGQLQAAVRDLLLDDLIAPVDGADPHLSLQRRMQEGTAAALRRLGIDVVNTRLGSLELPVEVTDQRIAYWRNRWEGERQLQTARGQAEAEQALEVARAEARLDMIRAITQGIERTQDARGPARGMDVIALRVVDAMESIVRQLGEPGRDPELVTRLDELRQQLQLLQSGQ